MSVSAARNLLCMVRRTVSGGICAGARSSTEYDPDAGIRRIGPLVRFRAVFVAAFRQPGRNAVRNGTGVGFRTAEGQLQFGFGLFETDAARSLDEDRPVADGMTGQMGAQRVDVGKDGETTRSGCREVGPH